MLLFNDSINWYKVQSTPASVEPVDFGGSVGGGDNGRSVMDTSVE